MKHKPLFIIPARSGSKGLPDKNILPLAGKPLIWYSIQAALALAPPERIVFSTDSEKYAALAEKTGLPVPYRRPASLATDTAGSREVILDAMKYADSRGLEYDCVVLLQPTSPLRTVGDIMGAMNLYTPDTDMVVSVKEASANPYYNCFETNPADGTLHISKGDGKLTRRQDAPPAYEFNGAVYVINPESIRKMSLGEFPVRIPYLMPADRSVDIDSRIDFIIAEKLLADGEK